MKKMNAGLLCAGLTLCFGLYAGKLHAAPAPPDTTKPVITLLGPDTVCFHLGKPFNWIEMGAVAMDNVEGDITHRMQGVLWPMPVDSAGNFYLPDPGICARVKFVVADTSGNVSDTTSRYLCPCVLLDTTKPVITLMGNTDTLCFHVGQPFNWTDPGATAFDNVDGNLTAKIMTSPLPVDSAGNFYLADPAKCMPFKYYVTDKAGNSDTAYRILCPCAPLQTDTTKPILQMIGPDTFCHTIGKLITPLIEPGVNAIDDVDTQGQLLARMVITWSEYPVDSSGRFTLKDPSKCAVQKYVTRDTAGNVSDTLRRWYCNCIAASVSQALAAVTPGIYPNPAQDALHVALPGDEAGIFILTDICGRVQLQAVISKNVKLDISGLAPGLYCYQLRHASGLVRGRLLKE